MLENIKNFGKILLNNNIPIESKIVNIDKDKQEAIINWIKQKINKNVLKFEKIFIMSENDTSSEDFHN